jgi:hypothetical protein
VRRFDSRAVRAAAKGARVFDFTPDARTLAEIFSSAISPAFFLSAVVGLVSLMTSRMNAAVERIRAINAISDGDQDHAFLKRDLNRLLRRAILLKSGIRSAVAAGVCATLTLMILFIAMFMGFVYAVGAGLLFGFATIFLCVALVRFAREVSISFDEADEY